MALAEWALRELLNRAEALGVREPQHYLLPLNIRKSRHLARQTEAEVGSDKTHENVGQVLAKTG